MQKWRQTFLNFQPTPIACDAENVATHQEVSNRIAEIPVELWALILESLSTITLKSFRLVCRYWARVGSDWLFDTAYVDSYSRSWERLRDLSNSQYASRVRKIVWTSLDLPYKPLGVFEWLASYPNILTGAGHVATTGLYEAYRRCVKNTRYVKLDTVGHSVVNSSRLSNLHELVITDGLDLESACQNSKHSAVVRHDTSLMESVAVWGHSPRIWRRRERSSRIEDFSTIFSLLAHCSTLVSCKISLWDRHWNQYIDHSPYPSTRTPSLIGHRNISQIELRVKYCKNHTDYLDDYEYRIAVVEGLHRAFQCMCDFPELESVVIRPSHQDPGPAFREIYRRELYDYYELDESDHDWFCEIKDHTCDCKYSGRSLMEMPESARTFPDTLDGGFSHSMEASFHPGLVTVTRLKLLVLYDTAVDLNGMVAWLCQQSSDHYEELTIHFRGLTILYGLDVGLFYTLASHFRTRIVCDDTIVVYDTESPQSHYLLQQHMKYNEDWFFWKEPPRVKTSRDWWAFRHGFNRDPIKICLEHLEPLTRPFRRCDQIMQIETIQEPLSLNQLLESGLLERQRRHDSYHYCMDLRHDGIVKFFWTAFPDDSDNLRKKDNVYILLAAQEGDQEAYDEHMWLREERRRDDYMADEAANFENEILDAEAQVLLSTYETELQGMDHFEAGGLAQ